jgi:hypothetical protein
VTTNRSVGVTDALSSAPDLAAIPDNVKIKLGTIAIVPTGTAGDSIRFAVVDDVVVDGVVRIPAGTWVNGVVSDTKRGSHRLDRDGQVTVRARDLKSGRAILVRVAGTDSADPNNGGCGGTGRRGFDPMLVGPLVGVAFVVIGLLAFTLNGDR